MMVGNCLRHRRSGVANRRSSRLDAAGSGAELAIVGDPGHSIPPRATVRRVRCCVGIVLVTRRGS